MQSWEQLIGTTWGDYVVHNLPFGYTEIGHNFSFNNEIDFRNQQSNLVPQKKMPTTKVSIYELQKSAINWNYSDFMESIDR